MMVEVSWHISSAKAPHQEFVSKKAPQGGIALFSVAVSGPDFILCLVVEVL